MKNLGSRKVQNSAVRSILVTAGCIALIVLLLLILIILNNKKVATVGIVQAKEAIYVNNVITEDSIQEYQMSQIEYDSSDNKYLLWEDRNNCIQKYAAVATKANGYIYVGDYNATKPTKNAYFQNLPENDLIVTLPYDYSIFGNLLTPGDKVKVNACFVPEVEEGQVQPVYDLNGISSTTNTVTVFEELEIIDMLNSSGNSVYDYYIDLLNMSLEERETMLRDDDFVANVSPKSLVLSVDKADEFNKYCQIRNTPGLTYVFGLYPRKDIEDSDIIGQFENLTREISAAKTASDSEKAAERAG